MPAKPGFESRNLYGHDANPEVGGEPALILRQEPPPKEPSPLEPTLEEPKPEEVKTANLELAGIFQDLLDYLKGLLKDLEEGKVQPNTKTKLSPEGQKIAIENIQRGIIQSVYDLVEVGKPLIEGEGKGEPAPGAE